MGMSLDLTQVVRFGELVMSQVVKEEVLARLFVEKGIFSKEDFKKGEEPKDEDEKRGEFIRYDKWLRKFFLHGAGVKIVS
jgi:hypothetical protein